MCSSSFKQILKHHQQLVRKGEQIMRNKRKISRTSDPLQIERLEVKQYHLIDDFCKKYKKYEYKDVKYVINEFWFGK